MKKTFTKENLIAYLQSELDDFLKDAAKFGKDDRIVQHKLDAMLANKDMVESLILEPVNLQKDGKVTVGF